MKRSVFRRVSAWSALALLPLAPAFAHHSYTMFDFQREVTLKGTVKEFQWSNPHVFIDLVNEADSSTWSVEMSSPSHLVRNGWKPRSLKAGDRIVLVIHPLRDGRSGGTYVSATHADGSPLVSAPAAAGASR